MSCLAGRGGRLLALVLQLTTFALLPRPTSHGFVAGMRAFSGIV
jgi:hypothetical protein